jgi:PiT family inorganic phosphate transporter
MDHTLILVVVIVAIALFFDFTNGFHDAANSIATTVSTRVLSPKQAVLWAAFFNFIAFLIFGTTVANTVGKGLININVVTMMVILAGLIGTILWNLTTWYLGLPTSSSHALIGGYAGAAIAKAGFSVVTWGGWYKTIAFIFIAPAIGFILGAAFIIIASWLLFRKTPQGVNRWSRRFQLVTAALYSLGHGGNDAQKTMGIITSLLFTAGYIQTFHVPFWVAIAANGAIAFGTLFGGWKIVKTMGMNITKLRPIDAICAETGSAISIFSATLMGVPVSTTHVITGAISGVGAAKRMSAVKWGVTLRIVWAWIFTIPLSGIFAYLIYKLISLIK